MGVITGKPFYVVSLFNLIFFFSYNLLVTLLKSIFLVKTNNMKNIKLFVSNNYTRILSVYAQ